MRHKIVSIFFALSFLLARAVQAQTTIFKRCALPEVVVTGFATTITQDAKGYMWIAGSGLYRYDGYRITTYKNNPLDSNSLASNQIETICSTRNGIIWIGTQGYGLDRFDPATGIFTHFLRHNPTDESSIIHNKVTALLEDRDGILWIGTHGGLSRFDPITKKFKHYTNVTDDISSLSCNQVRSIYEDRQGTIWVGTGSPFVNDDSGPDDGGLNRLDRKTGRFTRYMHDPKDPHSLINNKVCGVLEDSRGTFWVGSAGDGLHTMDRSKGTFERHLYDPAHPDKLSRPPLPSPVSFDHIRSITEDAAGYIWIGTVLAGMNRYDPVTQKVTYFNFDKNSAGINDKTGWSAFNSREGVLWTTSNDGIYYIDPLQKKISQTNIGANVQAILEEDSNVIWIGTNQSLIRNDRKTNKATVYKNVGLDSTSLSGNDIIDIYKDHRGDIWVGTRDGFNRFNKNTKNFTRFLYDEKSPGTLKHVGVFGITEDEHGSFWLATDVGIVQMDLEKNVVKQYKNAPEDTSSLSTPWAVAAHVDLAGNLWFGNTKGGGINLLNRNTRKFRHYLLGTSIGCFFEDSDRALWTGTDGGLFRYDASRDVFSLFVDPTKNIKTENIIVSRIVEDDKKNLWMSTSAGILKLNASRSKFSLYGGNYGVNLTLSESAYKGVDGKIYIGNGTGYFSFFPDSISGNSKPPQIVFEDFRIGDKSVKSGTNSPLKVEVNEAKEIVLKYDQSIFSLDFAGIHFSSPEENKHLFMLENYDKGWRQSGTEHTAYYYNVPPGHYVFRVQATSSNGLSVEKSVAIIITPPWWFTWWAYLIYAILFIAFAYSLHRFQKQRVINAERERTRAREQAQAKEIEKAYHELKTMQSQMIEQEKMASLGELTAGIAHEIQNPLNFVNNFSEVNAELIHELYEEIKKGNLEQVGAIAASLKENEEKIAHHGKRADGIVKGMLQHSRASTGQKESTDINKLADEYLRLSYHGMRAKDKMFNAEIETNFDPAIAKINIIPQDIGRVLLNLYNNAFYAIMQKKKDLGGDYKPKISVQTRKADGKVEIRVKDNGMGIPENIKGKIFQPFFTTKPTGQGTGLGLSLSYDIAKAHGGALKVETKGGEGTEFVVQLPV